jgi:hypothetical protein
MQHVASKNLISDAHFEAAAAKNLQSAHTTQRVNRRIKKLQDQLAKPQIDLEKVREAVWSGIPTSKHSSKKSD